jgi:hypothetical protein
MPTIFQDTVIAGSVTFNDALTKPEGAVVWGLDAMDGWDDTVSVEATSTSRGAGQDGEVFGTYFSAKARHLLLGGYVWATDRAHAEELMDVLAGDAWPANTDVTIVRHESVPKQVTGRVTDGITFDRVGPEKFRWTVPFSCPKAFKYDASLQTQGPVFPAGNMLGGFEFPLEFPLEFQELAPSTDNSAGIVNAGTAPTYATVTLTGPLQSGGWRVHNETTGKYIGFYTSASIGDVIVLDFENKTATLNGELITSNMFGDYWQISPRTTNVIKLYATYDPSTTMTVTARSAWR